MNRTPSSQAIQERLRLMVCSSCPWAGPKGVALGPQVPRTCEKKCPLFQQLPRLRQTAALLDPLLRSRHVVLLNSIGEIARQAGAKARRSGAKLARAHSFNRRKDEIARVIGTLFR